MHKENRVEVSIRFVLPVAKKTNSKRVPTLLCPVTISDNSTYLDFPTTIYSCAQPCTKQPWLWVLYMRAVQRCKQLHPSQCNLRTLLANGGLGGQQALKPFTVIHPAVATWVLCGNHCLATAFDILKFIDRTLFHASLFALQCFVYVISCALATVCPMIVGGTAVLMSDGLFVCTT